VLEYVTSVLIEEVTKEILQQQALNRFIEFGLEQANAKEYVRAAIASGLAVDDFGPRLSFFFVARTTLLEEVAKFRAARWL
jgi:methylmalonyl-CoA mutase N-terminal domain/subunit